MRAIDFHVHLPTVEWLDQTMRGYTEPAERYFRASVPRKKLEEVAAEYEALDIVAVLLAWDAETATHRPRLSNEYVAQAVRDFPDRFVGFGSVDPLQLDKALQGVDRIKELGLKGVKFHPSIQRFAPDDERYWPIFGRCEELGLIGLFHTGTSGIGAGMPGGQGIRLDYCRPIRLDTVAAEFSGFQIIAAHFGFPWHEEMLAIALHKSNVHVDISGWAPRYIPASVVREMKGRLQDRFLFGSDYPFITPQRWLKDFDTLSYFKPEVREKLLWKNGQKLLAHTAVGKMEFSS
jgi:predicted TIM-barrel fold metal-dependent hydrolase